MKSYTVAGIEAEPNGHRWHFVVRYDDGRRSKSLRTWKHKSSAIRAGKRNWNVA